MSNQDSTRPRIENSDMESSIESTADVTTPESNSDDESPQNELESARRQATEYLDMLQRMKADFDNFRKRKEKERAQMADYYRGEVISDLLPTLTALNLAIADSTTDLTSFKRGIELISDNLRTALTKLGLEQMNLVGTEFDPAFAEAVTLVPHPEIPANVIIDELSTGFCLNGKVLRPAQVIVSSGAPHHSEHPETNTKHSPGGDKS